MNDYKVLEQVSLFQNLEARYLKTIYKACTKRSFSPGDALVEQGTSGVGLFIIQSGSVKVQKTTESGEHLDVATHGSGEVIGEFSVLDGAPRTADVIAVKETECLLLSSWSFQAILKSHPEVALGILPLVVQRFRETNDALMKCKGNG
ncbi:Crp/Fnr family transcriptional regulator [Salinispira pacifica]|uniref:cAMP-binding protein n=1 Tax=Salinispira pacifica TaxID=1307761 RepID=V5WDV0_9SPIO|nr:cyclic nucleotide-binding domain-containing protein [Salinispira pacifica]AHC13744.1 cAMP-binding protein [Salinispira pacifica]